MLANCSSRISWENLIDEQGQNISNIIKEVKKEKQMCRRIYKVLNDQDMKNNI